MNKIKNNDLLRNTLNTEKNADFGALSLTDFALNLREWLADNIGGYDSDRLKGLTKSGGLGSINNAENVINLNHLKAFLRDDVMRFSYMQKVNDYPNNPFIIGYYKAEKYAEQYNLSADKMINYLTRGGNYDGLSWGNMLNQDDGGFNYEFLLTKFIESFILNNIKALFKGLKIKTYDNWEFVICETFSSTNEFLSLKLMTLKYKLN